MNEDNHSTDLDDAKILAKFSNLLNKYQSQGKITHTAATTATTATISETDEILPEVESDNKIPTLTEVVILHPSVIKPQPKRRKSIQQILDAALEDIHIEMDTADRKALAHALEVRLADQVK